MENTHSMLAVSSVRRCRYGGGEGEGESN